MKSKERWALQRGELKMDIPFSLIMDHEKTGVVISRIELHDN